MARSSACCTATQALIALAFHPHALAFEFFDLLTAGGALFALQPGQFLFVVVQRLTALAFFAGQAAVLAVDLLQARLQQGQPLLLAVAVHAQLQFTQFANAAAQGHQRGMVLARRAERFHLPSRGDHCMVRTIELGEVFDQPVCRFEGARLIEHEATQEGVEIAEVLR